MILALDIGNSNVVAGLWNNTKWLYIWRINTRTDGHAGVFYSGWISNLLLENGVHPAEVQKIAISSVVPDLNDDFSIVCQQIFSRDPQIVGPQTWAKLDLQIDRPSEIGTDLVCNAIAAVTLYQADCLVVDFGTALTFTSVLKDYRLLGVAIAPGLNTAMKSLYGNTAQLPEVPVKMPATVIGKNTEQAIQAGVLCGYYGLVEQMIRKTSKEAGIDFTVIATGGLSPVLKAYHELFDEVNLNLTLDGLRIIISEEKQ